MKQLINFFSKPVTRQLINLFSKPVTNQISNFFSKPVTVKSKDRSNIFVLVELTKLIEKLELGKENFKSAIVNQAPYFILIDPKDISDKLQRDWISIREMVGFEDLSRISRAESMKAPIKEKVSHFTKKDFDKLMERLHNFKSALESEL